MQAVLTVIASYGLPELTRTVVGDLGREADLSAVLVVDNQGDYEPVGGEEVARPGRNLGWLGACNLGLEQGARAGYGSVLLLNNDTRLSPGFVAGLLEAQASAPALLAPVYDDAAVAAQGIAFDGPAAAYEARPLDREVVAVDGTALLVSREHAATLGPLDARRFGRHGWGAIEDWCLCARQRGVPVRVTERSYLSHARGATADSVNTRYTHFAAAEMHYGLVRKWGRGWPLALPGSGHEPIGLRELAAAGAWHWLETTGLAARLQRPPSPPAA